MIAETFGGARMESIFVCTRGAIIAACSFVSISYAGRAYLHDAAMTIQSNLLAVLATACIFPLLFRVWPGANRAMRTALALALVATVLTAVGSLPVLWRASYRLIAAEHPAAADTGRQGVTEAGVALASQS